MRVDAHHTFSERYPLEHLGTILARNRFEGSVLIADEFDPAALVPDFVRAVVIRSDLRDTHWLDRYQEHPRFRGVCVEPGASIPGGLSEIERRNLTLDVLGGLELIPRIVEQFPTLRIAIDHLGRFPIAPANWEAHLERAAEAPHVFCKLSALTRLGPEVRPYVRHALGVFGPGRLMFGSGWPECLPDFIWKATLAAFTQAIGAQTIETREMLLGGTAERFYGL